MAFNTPDDLFYSESDEWIRIEGDIVTMGITDYAQDALNDIVYVELPDTDDNAATGESIASVESVKAASDIYSHVTGTVSEVNTELEDEPELINAEPYGKGWMVKIKVDGDVDTSGLMNAEAYAKYCEDR